MRKNNQIILATYGRSSGFCLDPIEKKPLNHFLPGTPVLSFGTAGCNLTCKFCQNWDISKSKEIDTLSDSTSARKIAATARELDCPSVAFTYNDPTIFMEYAIDIAVACKEQGIRSVAVTAGYICDKPRKEFYSYIDAANVDLKSFSNNFYKKICSATISPVLETLLYLKHKSNVWLELTTLIIPGENDSVTELTALCKWIAEELGVDVPIHFTAFHPDFKMLNKPRTPEASLTKARAIALEIGLLYPYTGNVHDIDGGSTYCSGCSKRLVARDWYEISDYNLNDTGHCTFCGTKCPGLFSNRPGDWGSKRMPVTLCNL